VLLSDDDRKLCELAWPGVTFSAAAAAVYFRVVAAGEADVRREDVYLACACAQGDPVALRHFDVTLVRAVSAAVRTGNGDDTLVKDVAQALREKILVGSAERGPGLSEYSGRGRLGGWLRVIATRELVTLRRRVHRERPISDLTLDGLEAPDSNPEAAFMRGAYKHAFSDAFKEAFSSLDDIDREILRRHHIDAETLDALSVFYGVHRATAARWLARARERLMNRTREKLARSLHMKDDELDSILRILEGKLHVTLRSYL